MKHIVDRVHTQTAGGHRKARASRKSMRRGKFYISVKETHVSQNVLYISIRVKRALYRSLIRVYSCVYMYVCVCVWMYVSVYARKEPCIFPTESSKEPLVSGKVFAKEPYVSAPESYVSANKSYKEPVFLRKSPMYL